MKVSRTAAVLVGCCALAATADVVGAAKITTGKPGKMGAASDLEAGNNHGGNASSRRRTSRALRGGGSAGHASTESGKTAKTHGGRGRAHATTSHHKKRSLKVKSQKGTGAGGGGGGGGGGNGGGNGNANRAYTAYAAAAAGGQADDNTPYVNNKFDYLDRYSAYLTPEQLQRLRADAPVPRDDETNVGGAEEAAGTAAAATSTAAASSYGSSSSSTQTAAVQQEGPAATPYVSTLSRQDSGGQPGAGGGDSNDDNERGYDATGTGNADALNRGFEAEAPIAGYNPATGYGSTGDGGAANANANANANGSGGALDATTAPPTTPTRPIVQTTEWRPIDRDVWVEHYVPGVGGNANPNADANANASFPNRNPSLSTGGGSANANRISATSAPCDGANPSAAPSQGIQHVFEDALWGTCSTTENGCNPGSCCLFHPTFNRGACVPFAEICEPGEQPGEGDCPYPWMTSNLCRCAGTGSGAVLP